MDNFKLISLIRERPQIWDRSHLNFRDATIKEKSWEEIGSLLNATRQSCKETFKSLREKYIREREKLQQFGDKYRTWDMLPYLSFLDPHIVPRKQNVSFDCQEQIGVDGKTDLSSCGENFEKKLITLVRNSSAIWDRNNNSYSSKGHKIQIWRTIAQELDSDPNVCMLKWKALREKYIRQKSKFQDGEEKWEFLDDLSFLDKVIHYRKKNCPSASLYSINDFFRGRDVAQSSDLSQYSNNSNENSDTYLSLECEITDSVTNDSCDDYKANIKQEVSNPIPDSSYDATTFTYGRKRRSSFTSDVGEKQERHLDKTPEDLFGDLVAAMLKKKSDREKNLAMIDIMQILTK